MRPARLWLFHSQKRLGCNRLIERPINWAGFYFVMVVGKAGFAISRSRTEAQFAELLQNCEDFTLSITPA